MSKKLITVGNVSDYISDNRIIVTENMIITPGAKDKLREYGVETVYEKKCCNLSGKDNELEKKAVEILVKDFNITDPSLIQKIITKIKETK